MVHKLDLLDLENFLAPGEDEKDHLSSKVMCLAQCKLNLLLLDLSSLDGQWHVRPYAQWSAHATFVFVVSLGNHEPGLSDHQ